MSKKVNEVVAEAPVVVEDNAQTQHLYVSVKTFNPEGRDIGQRVVDMYHYGTRAWMAKHEWWAFKNNHMLESSVATPEEVEEYKAKQAKALQDKYAKEPRNIEAVAA